MQPFRAKPRTALADSPDLPDEELLWAVCAAKLILHDVPIQSPPNLSCETSMMRGVGTSV